MKTAISIDDGLYKAAEAAARRLGISRSELYRRALAAFLRTHSDRLVTKALDEVYSGDNDTEVPDALLQRLQAASLPPESW
jgi:negative regulator of replication initiation